MHSEHALQICELSCVNSWEGKRVHHSFSGSAAAEPTIFRATSSPNICQLQLLSAPLSSSQSLNLSAEFTPESNSALKRLTAQIQTAVCDLDSSRSVILVLTLRELQKSSACFSWANALWGLQLPVDVIPVKKIQTFSPWFDHFKTCHLQHVKNDIMHHFPLKRICFL